MCKQCDYRRLLTSGGLEPTPHRQRVLEVIGAHPAPLSAQDIFKTLNRAAGIDRVTVYRILDVLAARGLVERLSSGGRSRVYGMAPNKNHPAHPHFHCRTCGNLQCLHPASLKVDLRTIKRSFTGEIQGVEVRIDGICKSCLEKVPGVRS
ncbi:MAG: Fur family transcriptional regulator [Hyphomicrobiales bacterium]